MIVRIFWRRDEGQADQSPDERLDLRLGLLAAGASLSTPYSLSHDTPMLVLAMIRLLARAWNKGWDAVELVAIALLLTLPYAQPLLASYHIPFGFCALSLMFCVLYRRYRQEAWAPRMGGRSQRPSTRPAGLAGG
jgi:hypothetical protein